MLDPSLPNMATMLDPSLSMLDPSLTGHAAASRRGPLGAVGAPGEAFDAARLQLEPFDAWRAPEARAAEP